MIRIKQDRCGYTGYTCIGAPTLADDMRPAELVCDDVLERTSDFVVFEADNKTVEYSYIDNYYNLPVNVRGFAMSVDTIIDMHSVSAPETSCKDDIDAFGSGFLDLYSAFQSSVTYKYGAEGGYVLASSNLLCAEDEFLYPPLLEPILDTEFPPPTFDIPPIIDPIADGIYVILATILNWMCVVEYKINDLYNKIKEISGIRNLLLSFATNKTTECDCFSIYLTDGKAFGKRSKPSKNPTYTVDGCTIEVNGQSVYIEGDSAKAPFYAYAVIPLNEDEDGVYSAEDGYIDFGSPPAGSEDEIIIGIGSVRLVQSSDANRSDGDYVSGSKIPKFYMFVVEQEECVPQVEVVRTPNEGFLYRMGGGTVPYKAYEYEECPEMTEDEEEEPDDGL